MEMFPWWKNIQIKKKKDFNQNLSAGLVIEEYLLLLEELFGWCLFLSDRKGGYLLGQNRKIEAVKSGGPDRHMLNKHMTGASLYVV